MAKRILIADDDPEVMDYLKELLSREGFTTFSCEKGTEVEKALADFKPDLLLLDAMLPGLDGLTLTRRIGENPATMDIPIIVITALGSSLDIFDRFPQIKATMHKPLQPDYLLTNIQNALHPS